MFALFFAAFGMGIAFCAPPGMVMSESVRRGLRGGFWSTLRLQLGSLIGDATWAVIGLTGAGLLVQQPLITALLMGCGAGLLFYLAGCAARDAWRGAGLQAATPTPLPAAATRGHWLMRPSAGADDFLTGALLSLTNPTSVAYWLALGGALEVLGISHPEPRHYGMFFTGFMIACAVWSVVTSALIAWGRQLLNPRFFRWINVFCAMLLGVAAFGIAHSVINMVLAGI
jgi:threonine/homoserine/homoserine lactone efflux protein